MSLETLKDKVEQLIEKAQNSGGGGTEEFVGIKYPELTGDYGIPKVADARNIPYSEIADKADSEYYGYWFANVSGVSNGGFYVYLEEVYLPDKMFGFGSSMFLNCINLTTIHGDFSNVRRIFGGAFRGCKKLPQIPYCPKLQLIGGNAFQNCIALTEVTLPATVIAISNNSFNGCTNLKDIYVPWAEGAIADAPWGATNATIHYNYNAEV